MCTLAEIEKGLAGKLIQNVPSAARVAAGAFGFLTLIQVFDGPEDFSSRQF
jgi:hypothetical protein